VKKRQGKTTFVLKQIYKYAGVLHLGKL